MRIAVVLLVACALAVALGSERADAAPGVKFGIQDDAWLEHGPGTLSSRVATLDRLGLDVVRVTLGLVPGRAAARRAALAAIGPPARRTARPRARTGRDARRDAGLGQRGPGSERRSARPRGHRGVRPSRRAPLPLRRPLGDLERAEQASLALPRVPGHVRAADPQPGLPRHQVGRRPGPRRRWCHRTAGRERRHLARRLHPGNGSRGSTARRVRAPPVSRLCRGHTLRRRLHVQDDHDGHARAPASAWSTTRSPVRACG